MRSLPLVACGLLAVCALGDPAPAQPAKDTPKGAEPKRLTVSFQAQPWQKVLEWLSAETGKPVVAQAFPTGTFTLVSPAGTTYTHAEVLDLLNEGLSAVK